MKKIVQFALVLIALSTLYLLFWPTGLNPESWVSPQDQGYEGAFAINTKLEAIEINHTSCHECEDVAIDEQGRVYGASVDGKILRYDAIDSEPITIADTKGRPLGLDFDTLGQLYIADAKKGLLRLDKNGDLSVLSIEHGGRPYLFTDDLEVGPDGKVYFSDASDLFSVEDFKLDLISHHPAGRLLVYDPTTNTVSLLLDQLYFANGIAVAADSSFVLVNETSQYRVLKYFLKGEKAGISEVFIDNLPGFPDGISRGTEGVFWLALISPRNPLIDDLSEKPFIRKIITRLPDWLQPAPERHSSVIGLNTNGEVIYNFQHPSSAFSQITSIQEWQGDLYLGSLHENGIGMLYDYENLK